MTTKQKIYVGFLITTCLLAGCSNDETKLKNDAVRTAELRQLNAKLDSGVRLTVEEFNTIDSIFKTFPKAPAANAAYEKALVQRKDWGTLADFYGASRQTDPESTKKLAKAYVKLGRYGEAYELVRDLDLESDTEMRRVATASLFQTGRYEKAKKLLDSDWTSILKRQDVSEMSIRGMIHFYDGEQEKALDVLNQVVKIDPGNITANNGLSRIYSSRGETEKAEASLARIRETFDKITAEEQVKTRYVEKIYKLQDDYKNKRFAEVISVGQEVAPQANEQQRLVIYQYMYNSYKALGKETEARTILEKARQLKKK